LGIRFPLNFAQPYLAVNITQFWQRWHMSLSQWLRDYLYIPLGGNRRGPWRTYVNLMLTMLLGGLWHGASWNFVLWGGYQGALLLGHRAFTRATAGTVLERLLGLRLLVPARVGLTLVCVMVGWVFFRAATLPDTGVILGQMFSGAWLSAPLALTPAALVLAALSLVLAVLERNFELIGRLHLAPSWCRVASYVVLFFALDLFAVTHQTIPFIYFQF
jgi:D-alanyl-lipoteichoic acid acyltransferase DltB (MBOAT superfamily)